MFCFVCFGSTHKDINFEGHDQLARLRCVKFNVTRTHLALAGNIIADGFPVGCLVEHRLDACFALHIAEDADILAHWDRNGPSGWLQQNAWGTPHFLLEPILCHQPT